MRNIVIVIVSFVLVQWFSLVTSYTAEQQRAYDFAFSQKITTVSSIEKANMNGSLTRVAMAKMISNFAMNVLWLEPDTSKDCSFSDVSTSLDAQYNYWVTQACQLWLMWIWGDGKKSDKFNPNWIVTRAQFATAFSRALIKSNWKNIKDGNPYYSTHLQYLQSEWIIKSVSNPLPSTVEKRWNVMIMMMRAANNDENVEVEVEQSWKISVENLAKLKDKWVIRWPKDAKITIVEFTELLCPYCQRQSQQWTIASVIKQFSGQVNSISRPFIIHWDEALKLSVAMECVGKLKSWVYYDVLDKAFWAYPVNMEKLVKFATGFGVKETLLQTCIDEWKYEQLIYDVMELWSKLWVSWTPTSIVVDNESWKYAIVAGAYPVETFVEAVESLLN